MCIRDSYTKTVEEDDDEAACGKAELIARSQPYCDTSYTVPTKRHGSVQAFGRPSGPARRDFLTAWAGIKSLVNKGLVFRTGNPPRYYFSAHGLRIAEQLAIAEGVSADPSTAEQCNAGTRVEPVHEPEQIPTEALEAPLYMPVRSGGATQERPHAVQDEADSAGAMSVSPEQPAAPVRVSEPILVSSDSDEPPPKPAPAPATTRAAALHAGSALRRRAPQHLPEPLPLAQRSAPRSLVTRDTASALPAAHQPPCDELPADSYTMHMIMDHREVLTRTSMQDTTRRVTFEELLRQQGVQAELRSLELGDVLWVARPKPNLPADVAQLWARIQEVALDVVIERKRLDDLAASILDGRWHDQKNRLRNSGIGQIVYLIEDYDGAGIMQRYGKQIQTALSSTQVIDGFFVQRTADAQGTCKLLATMHASLTRAYEVRGTAGDTDIAQAASGAP